MADAEVAENTQLINLQQMKSITLENESESDGDGNDSNISQTPKQQKTPKQQIEIRKHASSSAAEAVLAVSFNSHNVHSPQFGAKHHEQHENNTSPPYKLDENTQDLETKTVDEATWWYHNKDTIKLCAKWIFLVFWTGYSLAAFIIDFERARVLFVIEVLIICILIIRYIYRKCCIGKPTKIINKIIGNKILRIIIYFILIMAVIGIIALCTYQDPGRLVALFGLTIFIGGCIVFSWNRGAIKWRPVFWGFGLQFIFALLILRTDIGFQVFKWFGEAFMTLLDFTLSGSGFVFGYLATGQYPDGTEPFANAAVFAFSVLPTVIFFSSLVSILYYLGLLQILIYYLSILMQYTLGTSTSESLNAAGNIFVGMTEAPLLIRPFLKDMTRSELHAVMTGGFATIAGGVMAIYIYFGVPASHLLSASVMSAPAALAISKIVYPEDEISPTAQNKEEDNDVNHAQKVLDEIGHGDETNVIEAASNGASIAVGLAANITAMLIAFLGLIALLDYLFSYWGSLINWNITFTKLCGYIFYPIALAMGIQPNDAQIAGQLIGQKIVVNEFVAYLGLTEEMENGNLSDRSAIILIYALCGFSNFGSIGITLGGLTPLAPSRSKDLTQLVLSAMIAGNVACFMTACIAALLFDPNKYN